MLCLIKLTSVFFRTRKYIFLSCRDIVCVCVCLKQAVRLKLENSKLFISIRKNYNFAYVEVFAVLEDIGIDFLTKLLNSIYDSGKIPKDLAKSVFITLPKIPGTIDCELYRTISLMSHLTKVLLRIIMARMHKSQRPEISQLQFGFIPDKARETQYSLYPFWRKNVLRCKKIFISVLLIILKPLTK